MFAITLWNYRVIKESIKPIKTIQYFTFLTSIPDNVLHNLGIFPTNFIMERLLQSFY